MSLANKYRPKDFSEVVGQELIVRVLMRALDKKEIPHSILLAGPRGIGKTTIARLFAKGLNCELGPTSKPCNRCRFCNEFNEGKSPDIIEIDAASNRGIENIREIQNQARFLPLARYKVYIIDEAHMLTNEAFNSLLKILEEPPPYIVFILATTEPNKIPATVMSRLQKFALKPHSTSAIVSRLKQVCSKEGIFATDQALRMIAQRSEGSLRDALVLLEQAAIFSDKHITEDEVSQMLGVVPNERYSQLLEDISKGDFKSAISKVDKILEEFSPQEFASGFVKFLEESLLRRDENLTFEEKTILLRMALDMEYHLRDTFSPHSWIVYDLARMCSFKRVVNINEVSKLFGIPEYEGKETKAEPVNLEPLEVLRGKSPSLAAYLEGCNYSVEDGVLKIVAPDNVVKNKIENGLELLKEAFGVKEVNVQVRKIEERKLMDIFESIRKDWEKL
ncbi:MAG: DNA polymerase III subunit gamma/tau [candidate division WOR-3 bacterium]